MIRYRLTCPDAHEFEAWFSSSAAYDKQAEAGHVTGPDCGAKHIRTALTAPHAPTSQRGGGASGGDARPGRATGAAETSRPRRGSRRQPRG